MKVVLYSLLAVLSLLGMVGCATTPPPREVVEIKQDFEIPPPPKRIDGSVYREGYSLTLYEDLKAYRIGDILTVLLAESTNASKSAKTSTSKENAIDLANPTLLGVPLTFQGNTLASQLASDKSFTGEGDSEQSNNLSGSITVTVVDILSNGYLKIEGEKIISINQGDEYVRISGVVRPVDVNSDNTVLSTLIGNAKIAYGGAGVVADSNSMGWLAEFFNSGWWPF